MKWGIKINRFIDIINNRTRVVKRLIKTSPCIYTVENIITLAEIKRTVHENIIPIGSAISVNIIGVQLIDIKFHSKIIIC
jgi:hypothetical protein